MEKIKIKLDKPFPEEGFGFEKMFSNDKDSQIELTTPFVVEEDFGFKKMFSNPKILEIELDYSKHWSIMKYIFLIEYVFFYFKTLT